MPSIKECKVLVIGGSSGIGYGVAEKCLLEGAKVHIASSNASRVGKSAVALKQKFPSAEITAHICDLGGEDVEKSLEHLFYTIGSLDHIVFTAGDKLAIQPLETINLHAIRRAGHVRFAVPLLLAKLAPRFLNAAFSELVVGWGVSDWPYGITRNLALDLKPLRVDLVSPGVIATPLWGSEGMPESVKGSTTLGKVGMVEEVAEAYVYLMKDTNATGACISTNAGSLLL
ncbi:short-chain dehydrogenase [Aspergillus luchuensis IFO 4308]|nr:short-chain dehydrogenase [Aspergillus luchuensis IFO 4308]